MARCTRYCDEVEAVNAITLSNRGSATTIATVADRSLIDTTCELCGGCIDTCPTGALVEKKAPKLLPLQTKQTRTTCNFCGVGCQLDLHTHNDQVVKITSPLPGETLNDGNLCVKGRFAYDFIHHEERLTEPLIRREDGGLHPVSWDEAIRVAVTGFEAGQRKTWRRFARLCLVIPLHGRRKLSDAKAFAGCIRNQQHSSVCRDVTCPYRCRSGDNVWSRSDDQLNR